MPKPRNPSSRWSWLTSLKKFKLHGWSTPRNRWNMSVSTKNTTLSRRVLWPIILSTNKSPWETTSRTSNMLGSIEDFENKNLKYLLAQIGNSSFAKVTDAMADSPKRLRFNKLLFNQPSKESETCYDLREWPSQAVRQLKRSVGAKHFEINLYVCCFLLLNWVNWVFLVYF